jgi:glyceraldehyde 3-phosphate dehydrogenase
MMAANGADGILGINGLGRIGKLTLWHEAGNQRFERLVVNTGRQVGKGIDAIVRYLSSDSTYGSLGRFLFGHNGPWRCIDILDRDEQLLSINGVEIKLLTEDRNPKDIGWAEHGVKIVIDTTGRFRDPTLPAGHPGGSIQGHLEAGAQLVLVSAAFKMEDRSARIPDDAGILIFGINHDAFEPRRHCMVSAASCTTTALAHMMLPLLDHELTHTMLTASMSTVHASTNSQSVLDSVPKAGDSDLRKNRSIFNNIILTTTNAAAALEHVMPEIATIGFLADSVRVPLNTTSLIILNCTFQSKLDEYGNALINRQSVNSIFDEYANAPDSGVLFTEEQSVSSDMIGEPFAVIIEGSETHARTGFTKVNLAELGLTELDPDHLEVEVPVTHLKLFGWYDNELGSYTRRMSQLCHYMADRLG